MFATIEDIKRANRRAGKFFFEPDTLRFFRSRIGETVWVRKDGSAYFITSEQFVPSSGRPAPRRYTIRLAKVGGDIDTVGEFQAYASRAAAVREIKRLLRPDETE
jgi:hypothetical protein